MTEQNDLRLTIALQDIRESMQKVEQRLQWLVTLIAALLFTSGSNVALRVPEIAEQISQTMGAVSADELSISADPLEVE